MALSLRGTAENAVQTGSDVTLTHPGGIAENDVVYVTYGVTRGLGSGDFNMTMATAGYTELADLFADSSLDPNLGVFRKVMGATPDSTAVCDGTGGFADPTHAVEHVWTGADTTTPEDATTTTATSTTGGNPDSPSITTVTADAVVLSCGYSDANDEAVTAPTNYSNQVDIIVGFDAGTAMMASRAIASAGAENPAAWSDVGGNGWCAATVAIRPAGGGGTPFEPPNVQAPLTLRTLGYGRGLLPWIIGTLGALQNIFARKPVPC